MNKLIFSSILYFVLALVLSNALYAKTIEETFLMFPNGEIAYYKMQDINTEEYRRAENIKKEAEAIGEKVYAVVIADIFSSSVNEYILLSNDKLSIYDKDERLFEFCANSPAGVTKAALEIVGFTEKEKDIKILKYYTLKETAGRKKITLYLFRIEDSKTEHVGEVLVYDEITSAKVPVTIYMENRFADTNGDGNYEMLVAMREKVGSRERVEYQIYAYDKKDKIYLCQASDWTDGETLNIDSYF